MFGFVCQVYRPSFYDWVVRTPCWRGFANNFVKYVVDQMKKYKTHKRNNRNKQSKHIQKNNIRFYVKYLLKNNLLKHDAKSLCQVNNTLSSNLYTDIRFFNIFWWIEKYSKFQIRSLERRFRSKVKRLKFCNSTLIRVKNSNSAFPHWYF